METKNIVQAGGLNYIKYGECFGEAEDYSVIG